MAGLVNAEAQNFLEKYGFNCLPLFSQEEISALRALFEQHFGKVEVKGMYSNHSLGVTGTELTIAVSKKIEEIVGATLRRNFKDFKFFLGAYIAKQANFDQEFDLHQDWNIVNEQKKQSIQVWIPLTAITPENGGLFMMRYSHRFYQNYRSGSFGVARLKTDQNIKPYIDSYKMKPGECIVYYNSTFHGSFPNHSSTDRLVAIVNLVPESEPAIYYHLNKKRNITEAYRVDAESFLTNLEDLEQGRLPESLHLLETSALPAVDNNNITSADIAKHYKKFAARDSRFNSILSGVKKFLSFSE